MRKNDTAGLTLDTRTGAAPLPARAGRHSPADDHYRARQARMIAASRRDRPESFTIQHSITTTMSTITTIPATTGVSASAIAIDTTTTPAVRLCALAARFTVKRSLTRAYESKRVNFPGLGINGNFRPGRLNRRIVSNPCSSSVLQRPTGS